MSRTNPSHAADSQERLAFSFHASVPARRVGAEETFATTPISEPRDWGYTGLLGFTIILLFRPQDDIPALEMIRPAELFAVLAVAPMLLHRFACRLPVFRVTRETIALFAFAGVMLATVPFSIWPGGAIMEFVETFSKVLVIFVLMMNTVTTPRRIQQISTLMFLAGGYIAARGIFNYVRGVNLIEGGRLAGPVGGIFGNPNDLALNLVALLPLAIVAAFGRRYSTPWRWIAALSALLMMATIVFTKSRGGMIGLAVMLLALVVLSFRVRPSLAVGLVAGVLIATPFVPQSFTERMATIFNPEADAAAFTGSHEARTTVMKEGLTVFWERPLTGVGAGQFANYDYPGRVERWREAHNSLIQVAADLGVFGLIAFAYLIYRAIRTSLWLRRTLGPQPARREPSAAVQVLASEDRDFLHDHAVATGAAMLGWLTSAMFASVAYSWTFYYLLALAVASRELVLDQIAGRGFALAAKATPRIRHSLRSQAEPVRA
jgi:putative inorganic carbon (HCO3(-)) transporter